MFHKRIVETSLHSSHILLTGPARGILLNRLPYHWPSDLSSLQYTYTVWCGESDIAVLNSQSLPRLQPVQELEAKCNDQIIPANDPNGNFAAAVDSHLSGLIGLFVC